MRYRKSSKLEQRAALLATAAVFAVVGGLVLAIPASINFQLALAQGQQQQQQPPPSATLNNTTSSASSITTSGNETSSNSSATNNQTGIGEPLPSPTQTNATMLHGEIGSIQSAHEGAFSWSTAGDWTMQLDGPLEGRAEPKIQSFNATIHMVRLDGNVLHEHRIYNFNQSSVTQVGDDMTTFNGTMTVTLREGPVENVAGYIQLLGDSIAIWVDPRAVENHFGPTPIHGMVLPEQEGQASESG
ncbi:MAG: hypothetical protein M3270_07255 [Thermoproteota archaeon]|nr:hypothetical protein [Thermoproteota archaeon]